MPKYRRVLLKISGEALAGSAPAGIDADVVEAICREIKQCVELGVEMAIVVGGGNFWRGRTSERMNRTRADHMGMLGTMINALALCDALEQLEVPVRVQSAILMTQIAEPYIRGRAVRHLEKGRVVIFGGGTGNPFFSTDTTASLRAAEIDADVILKASLVDGVYDKDPNTDPSAVRYDRISYSELLRRDLKVMDSTAAAMCKDNHIPLFVFSLRDPHNIVRAVCGENVGTIVTEE